MFASVGLEVAPRERGEYNRFDNRLCLPHPAESVFASTAARSASGLSIDPATARHPQAGYPAGRAAASARRPHEAPPLAKLLPTAQGVLGADPPASRDDLRRPGHTQRLDALGTGAALWYEDRLRQHPWRPSAARAADAHRGPAGRPRPTAGRLGRSDGRAGRGIRIGRSVVEVELDAGDCSSFAYRSASRSSTMPCGCRCIACTI